MIIMPFDTFIASRDDKKMTIERLFLYCWNIFGEQKEKSGRAILGIDKKHDSSSRKK